MNIGIKTLGCKANRADTDQLISRIMKEFGAGVSISEVNNANDLGTSVLDVCVVNTCTVTHVADRKSRSSIRTFRREFPEAKIIVMGCGPKADHEAYQKVTGVDLVSSDVEEVLNFLNSLDLGKTDASEGT
ncbi:hypothetical protein HOE67_04330, partial [Candidatus Peregrinibacteria bacterium]|nr:hypothetical protein [Candidatus Peregrinibacteria bacterium]